MIRGKATSIEEAIHTSQLESAAVPTQIDVGRTPPRSSLGAELSLAGFSIGSSHIPRTTIDLFAFNGYDAKIEQVRCVIRFPGSAIVDYNNRAVRGRLYAYLIQRVGTRETVNLTVPQEVVRPGAIPFLLGSTADRIAEGHPIFLRIDYEAASGTVPVFWDAATFLSLLVTLA